jgi:1-deoxy-D-xylulose-5-phosphate reductoisomerase
MSSPPSADPGRPRGVAVLGSTGSIGRQAIEVLAAHTGRFAVRALAAGQNEALLAEQATRLGVPAAIANASADQLEDLAVRDDVDLVIVGTGGMVSLRPILAALGAGKVVATANKETLVAGGHLVMPLARNLASAGRDAMSSPLAWLRPIDSEHSAIWQCLVGEGSGSIDGLILTASGGPFLEEPSGLAGVTPEMALRHPTWQMGRKITVDSATLANKGLEVIEAHWLYDVPYDAIEVVIHPQSVVHSAVRFVDGSVKAQLGTPDMRLPIQYALTYPDRQPSPVAAPDLVAIGRLDFRAPDEARFPALRISREAGRTGSRATAALIAADEVAVSRFLGGSLGFDEIPGLLAAAVERYGEAGDQRPSLDELVTLDAEVRGAFAAGPIGRAH